MDISGRYFSSKMSETDIDGISKYTQDLKACIIDAGEICTNSFKDEDDLNPLMLLGRIQSGKTRAFIGLISLVFDNGFDLIIVLSKNSKSLVMQTTSRLRDEFKSFRDSGEVIVKDITQLPDEKLTPWELERKHIIVAKKETRNLDRIIRFILENSISQNKKCLIIDDEADITSIGFTKIKGTEDEFDMRTIAEKVNSIRGSLGSMLSLTLKWSKFSVLIPRLTRRDSATKNQLSSLFFLRRTTQNTLWCLL